MDQELADAITAELRAFVDAAGRRRSLPTRCHVGRPGAARTSLTDVDGVGLRADLVERAIDGLRETDGACAWVTRGGELGATDGDLAWLAAARSAFARHGLRLPVFAVVTRSAWQDLLSGEQRAWGRVRAHRSRAG